MPSPAKVETDAIRARMVRKTAGFGVYSTMGLVEGTEILRQRQEQKAKRIGSLLRQRCRGLRVLTMSRYGKFHEIHRVFGQAPRGADDGGHTAFCGMAFWQLDSPPAAADGA